MFTGLHQELSAKAYLQSLQPVLSKMDNDLILQMEKEVDNANGLLKILWLKIGDQRDSELVFASAVNNTHANCCFPFWAVRSWCLQADGIWAW